MQPSNEAGFYFSPKYELMLKLQIPGGIKNAPHYGVSPLHSERRKTQRVVQDSTESKEWLHSKTISNILPLHDYDR